MHEFLKNQLDIYFLVIWDIFRLIITVLYDNGFLLMQGLYVVNLPSVLRPKRTFKNGALTNDSSLDAHIEKTQKC